MLGDSLRTARAVRDALYVLNERNEVAAVRVWADAATVCLDGVESSLLYLSLKLPGASSYGLGQT